MRMFVTRTQPFRTSNILKIVLTMCWVSAGCHHAELRKVYAAGGTVGEVGLGIPLTDEVSFYKLPNFGDDEFARIYPTLQHLHVSSLLLEDVPVTDASIQRLRQ